MNKVSGQYLLCIIEACYALGFSKQAMARLMDVKTIRQDDVFQRFEGHHIIDLYEAASAQLNEPNIGLKVGTHFNVSWLNETGKVLPFCANLGEAGLMLGRYHRLTQSFGTTQIGGSGNSFVLEWQSNYENFEKYKHVIEAIFTGMAIATKWLLWDQKPAVDYVQFRHAQHGDYKAYEEIFDCPVYFSSDVDAIGVNSAYLNLPLVTHNEEMKLEMCRQLDRLMFRLEDEASLIERIRASIREQLHESTPSFSNTVKHLDIDERQLRYKLKRQETSFRKIVESVRREICEIEMRKNTQMSVIAQKLGFHDQSAFNRAFRKWYNVAPKQYQASHSAALGAK